MVARCELRGIIGTNQYPEFMFTADYVGMVVRNDNGSTFFDIPWSAVTEVFDNEEELVLALDVAQVPVPFVEGLAVFEIGDEDQLAALLAEYVTGQAG